MEEYTQHLIDVNKDNLDHVISFVDVMDGKAKFILTLVLVLTGYLVTQLGPYLDAQAKSGPIHPWAPVFFVILDLAAVGCLFFFVWTAITVVCAINPRLKQETKRPSPLFFDTIAGMSHEEFKKTMTDIVPNKVVDTLIDQTYDNAVIVKEKTKYVRRSINLFWWGMILFFTFSIGRPILVARLRVTFSLSAAPRGYAFWC
jgi:hypothetical protein